MYTSSHSIFFSHSKKKDEYMCIEKNNSKPEVKGNTWQ